MEAMLRHVVTSLVTKPDQVRVTCLESASNCAGALWELRVAPEDFPRIIGRGGKTARALRALLEAADRNEYLPSLNIVDPEDDGEPI